ncbi:unnamed protein product [Acanthocheilonema viteae]|uniref:HMG box domain-containing protein n=1 Tax=Acanthocheilonema viteae TaxID=6277 RepID=A0A498S445_ACAVI|nr:unnamed protein product [Acanthocheilonema viteae]
MRGDLKRVVEVAFAVCCSAAWLGSGILREVVKMTKKRSSNGFMYFADARRAFYTAENKGMHLTAKKLVERATRDWKLMSEEERHKWRSESSRRHDEIPRRLHTTVSVSACTGNHGSLYERQVYQMQSISIMNKSKRRPLSKLELSLQPKPFSYRLTESKRKSLRQSIYQKLVWREKEDMVRVICCTILNSQESCLKKLLPHLVRFFLHLTVVCRAWYCKSVLNGIIAEASKTEVLAQKRFGLLTVRPYCIFQSDNELICPPAEICTYVMSLNEGIVNSERILIRHDYPTNHQFYQFSRISENGFSELSQTPNHLNVHHACLRIANEMKECWANLILVPASQYQTLAASLAWIKQKRDIALKRDTTSIRTERLICVEDMIAVIGRIVETDVEENSRWEQNILSNFRYACDLHTTAPSKCPMVVGKSACQHFLNILRNLVDCNYRTREKCIFKIDDAKRCLNPTACPVRHNRINPFRVVSHRNPKDNHITNDEPFSLIRLRAPDKMEYVTKWLNSLDINIQMFETDNMEQGDF